MVQHLEHAAQCTVIDWIRQMQDAIPELQTVYAVINGAKLPYMRNKKGKRYSSQALYLLREGLKPGVPDIACPFARGGYHALYIELKIGKNKPTKIQQAMIDRLIKQGNKVDVCYSADDAIDVIKDYLGIKGVEQ